MTILDKIITSKKREVLLKKSIIPITEFKRSVLFERKTVSLSNNLIQSSTGIIAEHKRRSPSKGEINYAFSVEEVVQGYDNAGVCGISVLTDSS